MELAIGLNIPRVSAERLGISYADDRCCIQCFTSIAGVGVRDLGGSVRQTTNSLCMLQRQLSGGSECCASLMDWRHSLLARDFLDSDLRSVLDLGPCHEASDAPGSS